MTIFETSLIINIFIYVAQSHKILHTVFFNIIYDTGRPYVIVWFVGQWTSCVWRFHDLRRNTYSMTYNASYGCSFQRSTNGLLLLGKDIIASIIVVLYLSCNTTVGGEYPTFGSRKGTTSVLRCSKEEPGKARGDPHEHIPDISQN